MKPHFLDKLSGISVVQTRIIREILLFQHHQVMKLKQKH